MNDDKDFKDTLKQLILDSCEKEGSINDIGDDDVLFGKKSMLELDSMDALQISMALSSKYGIRETDSKKLRKIMTSINTLAKYIQS